MRQFPFDSGKGAKASPLVRQRLRLRTLSASASTTPDVFGQGG